MRRHVVTASAILAGLLLNTVSVCSINCLEVASLDAHACCSRKTFPTGKDCASGNMTSEAARFEAGLDHSGHAALLNAVDEQVTKNAPVLCSLFPAAVHPSDGNLYLRISVLRV